ncbi:MAG: hypothetical protein LBG11_02765 [Bifidobacteriaceae bacterium]|nr:hypothetical protein [Bifidobacteriaceae bacterium]
MSRARNVYSNDEHQIEYATNQSTEQSPDDTRQAGESNGQPEAVPFK